ncbi:hypothetical protein HPB51_005540 [Rhipicephalus microplus]|uniref:THAP-type domain-containing protein n=1 Tax=Rhipicephalus microplus TaxID=6941 RepID=A0A9J6EXT3_RHIMP|nr:hypothetical protein HPB51_005540 [Rhipicephalus microplus]
MALRARRLEATGSRRPCACSRLTAAGMRDFWTSLKRMFACCAVNCTSRPEKSSGKTFHAFSRSQPHLYQQWVVNLKRDKWKPSPGSRLCSSHFTEACFDRSGSRTRLKSDAIPTLFSFPEHLQKHPRFLPVLDFDVASVLDGRAPIVVGQRPTNVYDLVEAQAAATRNDYEVLALDPQLPASPSMSTTRQTAAFSSMLVQDLSPSPTPGILHGPSPRPTLNTTPYPTVDHTSTLHPSPIQGPGKHPWVPSNHSKVCSLHFKPTYYREGLKLRKLKADAIPSEFLSYPAYLQKQLPNERKALISHPLDPDRPLFLSFDFRHVIKDIVNQFLDTRRIFRNNGVLILPDYLRLT